MLKKCALCGKGALKGKIVSRKGQYKAKGAQVLWGKDGADQERGKWGFVL